MTRSTVSSAAAAPQHPSLDALAMAMAQRAAEGGLSDATNSPPTLSPAASSLASPGASFAFPGAVAARAGGGGLKGEPSGDGSAPSALSTLLKAVSAVGGPAGSAVTSTASSPSSGAPSPMPGMPTHTAAVAAPQAEAASRLGCLFAAATSASAPPPSPPPAPAQQQQLQRPQPLQEDRAAGAMSSGSSTTSSAGHSSSSGSSSSSGRTKRPLARGAEDGGAKNKKAPAMAMTSMPPMAPVPAPGAPPLAFPGLPMSPPTAAAAAPMMGTWGAPPPPPPAPIMPSMGMGMGVGVGMGAPAPAPWMPAPGAPPAVPPSLAAAVGPAAFLPPRGAFPPSMGMGLLPADGPVPVTPSSSASSAASACASASGSASASASSAGVGMGVGVGVDGSPLPEVLPEDALKLGEMNTRVGLLPGIRPVSFDKHLPNPAEEGKAKRAHRECLSSLSAEEKLERRRERARVYSHMVRRRTEASLKELMGEVERLTVFRLLLEEMSDALLVVSPDATACVLFASGQGQGAGAGSHGHRPSAMALAPALLAAFFGRPLEQCLHPDDVPKALKGVLGVAARPDARYRCLLRLRDVTTGGFVEAEATMKLGTQGVICGLRRAGEPEGFFVDGRAQDERALIAA